MDPKSVQRPVETSEKNHDLFRGLLHCDILHHQTSRMMMTEDVLQVMPWKVVRRETNLTAEIHCTKAQVKKMMYFPKKKNVWFFQNYLIL